MAYSEARNRILSSLSVLDKDGATRDELIVLDAGGLDKATRRSYGHVLANLVADGQVIERYGRFYLKEAVQAPGAKNFSAQGMMRTLPDKTALPALAKTRSGHTVLLYTSPMELPNVARVELCIGGNWFRCPLFGDLRICLGPEIPRWSADQETNRGIAAIKVIALDGKTEEIQTNPQYPITIAKNEEV